MLFIGTSILCMNMENKKIENEWICNHSQRFHREKVRWEDLIFVFVNRSRRHSGGMAEVIFQLLWQSNKCFHSGIHYTRQGKLSQFQPV